LKGPTQDPVPFAYLQDSNPAYYDIQITCSIKTAKATRQQILSTTNYKYMYWSHKQQTVHHTITGCNLRPGDLLASGTISGEDPSEFGSLLEKTWMGKNAWKIEETGEERKYLVDGDSITMSAYSQGNGFRVGFGSVTGTLLPAVTLN